MDKTALVDTLFATGVTGATVFAVYPSQPAAYDIVIERVILENKTSNGTTARLNVYDSIRQRLQRYFAAFNANVPQMHDTSCIYISRGKQLSVQLASTTDGDNIEINLSGYIPYDG